MLFAVARCGTISRRDDPLSQGLPVLGCRRERKRRSRLNGPGWMSLAQNYSKQRLPTFGQARWQSTTCFLRAARMPRVPGLLSSPLPHGASPLADLSLAVRKRVGGGAASGAGREMWTPSTMHPPPSASPFLLTLALFPPGFSLVLPLFLTPSRPPDQQNSYTTTTPLAS